MNQRLQILILLSLSGLVLASPVIAQDNEPTLPSATEAGETVPEEEIPAAQEVEITEDNYVVTSCKMLLDPLAKPDTLRELFAAIFY